MTDRPELMMHFLKTAGWGDAQRRPLAGDASSRRYERLKGTLGDAVLMDAPPSAETPACPPGASKKERQALGYNAQAVLAGDDLTAFIALARWLASAGFSAPRILAEDRSSGFLLLEDLGDDLFASHLQSQDDEKTLYQAATDVLHALHAQDLPETWPGHEDAAYVLKPYDSLAVAAETQLLTTWYAPLATSRALPDKALHEYDHLWSALGETLQSADPVLVLRDYHAENLLWLPDRARLARVGLLDFQDAVLGHAAYDLVSLLEDARRDVPIELANAMVQRYCAQAKAANRDFEEAAFRSSYAAWGAQRNAKILGIFARLATRDHKPQYLEHIPRVWNYLERDLEHPALHDLKAWFGTHFPSDIRQQVPVQKDLAHG